MNSVQSDNFSGSFRQYESSILRPKQTDKNAGMKMKCSSNVKYPGTYKVYVCVIELPVAIRLKWQQAEVAPH